PAQKRSARKEERLGASRLLGRNIQGFSVPKGEFIEGVGEALYVSKIGSYAQGMSLIRAGSDEWKWNINLSEVARIWQGGCIIRARFLRRIKEAFARRRDLPNLLIDEVFRTRLEEAQARWRMVVC